MCRQRVAFFNQKRKVVSVRFDGRRVLLHVLEGSFATACRHTLLVFGFIALQESVEPTEHNVVVLRLQEGTIPCVYVTAVRFAAKLGDAIARVDGVQRQGGRR